MTVDFRDVVGDALDSIDDHVTNNYARLEKVDGWFWVGLASALGIQVEIVWLIAQVLMERRERCRMKRVRTEPAGGTHEKSRV